MTEFSSVDGIFADHSERALGRALPYWRRMQAEFQTAVGPSYWSNLRSELERLAKLTVSLESTRVQAGA
jgi:hypothetical protein